MRQDVRQALGDAFLAGSWNEDGLLERAHRVLRVEPGAAWLARTVRRTLRAYRYPPYDAHREFHGWLGIQLRRVQDEDLPRVVGGLTPIVAMGRTRWPVPTIVRLGDLAAQFDLDVADL